MRENQDNLPTYWVGHDPKTEEVFIYTSAKRKEDTESYMDFLYTSNWREYYEIIQIKVAPINS